MYVNKILYNDDYFYIKFVSCDQETTEDITIEEISEENSEDTTSEVATSTDSEKLSDEVLINKLDNINVTLQLLLFFYLLFKFKAIIHRAFFNTTKEM